MEDNQEIFNSIDEMKIHIMKLSRERDLFESLWNNEKKNADLWQQMSDELYRAACGHDRPMIAVNKYLGMKSALS